MFDDTVFMQVSRATAHDLVRALESAENLTGGAVSFLSDLKRTLARADERADAESAASR